LNIQKRAIIFANGVLKIPKKIQNTIADDNLIITADGGTRHCIALGITPHVVIGDFDSLSNEDIQKLEKSGTQLVRYPSIKDETDLELALQYALSREVEEMIIYGGLGDRMDMSIANLLLMTLHEYKNVRIRFLDGNQEITLVRGGSKFNINGQPDDTVSLIPIGGSASGVTTKGLEYPLENGNLDSGSPRGVSNVMLTDQASVSVEYGMLLCIFIRNTPL
jgi:thiamine pyrophosphokinase